MSHGLYPHPRDPQKVRLICRLRERRLTWAKIASRTKLSTPAGAFYLHTRWHSWWMARRIKGTP